MTKAIISLGFGFLLVTAAADAKPRTAQERLRPTDERLERLVEAALANDPLVESYDVVVSVLDGAVTLHGAVDTSEERARAGAVAGDVEGVREVENDITVATDVVQPRRDDEEIREEITEALAKTESGRNVEVTVEDAIVTLSGTVESASERRELTEIAFHAGVVLVRNQVEVEEN